MASRSGMRARGIGLALLAGALSLAPQARAQKEKPPGNAPAPMGEPVRLPEDVQARQKLAAAHDYVKVQAWAEVTRLLQSLLDARTDSFRRVSSRDRRGRPGQRWVSIRTEAEQLLVGLPEAGKEFYRLTYEARARKDLAAARAGSDPAALLDVVRRFRFTAAGAEALERLASYYLDRGQADLAAACFRRLLRHPGAERLAPVTLFKAALAERAVGDRSEEAWHQLTQRLADGGLQLGNDTYGLEKLRQMRDRWPGASVEDSPLYRGDPARSARGHGDFFLLEPRWRVEGADGVARQWLSQAGRLSPRPVLPAATPLAVEGKLIYRAADGLHALDAATGRPLWHSPTPLSLTAIAADSGKKVQLADWLRRYYGPGDGLLIENGTLGTLSSDRRRVYAVEDLPVPPPGAQQNGGPVPSLGPMTHFAGANRLRAVDAGSGRLVWEVGGPAPSGGKADSPLANAYFLGPPLPLGGQLFVLVVKQEEVSLVGLDPEHGAVRWTQLLATARDKMTDNVLRRTQAAHLAYADGVLVCPTGAGALLGFDPLSHGLLWVHVYARPPAVRDDAPPETPPGPLTPRWQGGAPIVHAGRVLFAPPDGDALYCLDLHNGALLWKAPRTDDDLYVGCAHKGTVLVVGKTACRALGLESGQTLWRRAIGQPAGQGVLDGPTYYLPLREGAILSLNLERSGDAVQVQSRAVRGDLGNLVFHRGTLWSQNATTLLALTALTAKLAGVEKRLAHAPHDPALLLERGRLRLDRSDWAGATADLRDALAHDPSPSLRASIRDRLFVALTELLRHDFDAGQKYLDEYRDLCRVPISSTTGAIRRRLLEQETERRQTQRLALVALGREKQGRILDALSAYRELARRTGERMTAPDDPAVQTRPDLWAQGRVAALLARSDPAQRQQITEPIRREGRALVASPDRAALRRFVALFDAVTGDEAVPVREAQLLLARTLAHASGRRHALEAELLLHRLEASRGDEQPPELRARALREHALLLTRHGLLAESVAIYRRLASEHAGTIVHNGKTGAQLLEELRNDKRFLAHVEPRSDPWGRAALKPSLTPRGLPVRPLDLPCVPCRVLPNGATPFNNDDGTPPERVSEPPDYCRRLRFTLDGSRLQLRVAERATGAELYSIPLPLAFLPDLIRDGEVCYQAVDHLLVLCAGPTLLGVDLLERRVRWRRHLLDERVVRDYHRSIPGGGFVATADGGVVLYALDPGLIRRVGLIGPVGPSAVCVQTVGGLIALDPATGDVRWSRTDVPRDLTIFGDEDYLFLAERGEDGPVRGVRAVRARDGVSVPIPDAVAVCTNARRRLGRLLLVADTGPDERLTLLLYDPLTGKDLWRKTVPAGSFLLACPEPRWLGVVEPDGAVLVVDLVQREEVARLSLDRRHLAKVTAGTLLLDREQFYVALRGPITPEQLSGEPIATFRGLPSVLVNGMIYAFGRPRGELRWFSWLPAQALLLDQFDRSPVLLCCALNMVSAKDNVVGVWVLRSLDKRTGKILFNHRAVAANNNPDLFHSFHLDPHGGLIDLLASGWRLRHTK